MTLERRVDLLERRVRRLRVALGAVLIAGAAAVMMAAAPTPDVLQARAFVLVDEQGRTHGQLAVAEDGTTSFLLTHPTGRGKAGLTVEPSGGSAITLESSRRTATLQVTESSRATLRFNHKQAKTALEAGIDEASRPTMVLTDKAGKVVFTAPPSK